MRKIEVLSQVALLVASLLWIGRSFGIWPRDNRVSTGEQTYSRGTVISDTPDLRLGNSSKTVILATDSACRWCTESMGFFRRLVEVAQLAGAQVIGVTNEDTSLNSSYLHQHGVLPERVVSAPANGLRIVATPSIVLVGQAGVVIEAWTGRLDREGEARVFRTIQD
jgi:hypothetical protein